MARDRAEVLWRPSPDLVAESNLERFRAQVRARTGRRFADHRQLHEWSVDRRDEFWGQLAEFAGVDFSVPPDRIKGPDRMPGTEWFRGARLNLAQNLLSRRDEKTAIIYRDESGQQRNVSYRQLELDVAAAAAAMRRRGIVAGDRVAGYLTNCPETVVAALATISIGAVWTACSPDFGSDGAVARLGQVRPRLVFASDRYFYGGREFDCRGAAAALAGIESVEGVVRVPYQPDPSATAGPATGRAFLPRGPGRRRSTRSCRSTTPATSSIRRGPPVLPRGSCTVPAARCCSTARSTFCTATCGHRTWSSTGPPAAG